MKFFFTLVAVIFGSVYGVSSVAFAASSITSGLTDLSSLITYFTNTVVKSLGTLFMAGAMVAFLFGLTRFIWASREGNATEIDNGKRFMMWGLVGLFVMFSVYGIVKFAQSTLLNGYDSRTITIPDINFGGGGSGGNAASPLDPSTTNNTTGATVDTPYEAPADCTVDMGC
ncbi:MAG: hypothetical protein RLZZ308_634 [Candidatus Parcubacteria bacterium]|jgi:hypothetical protein